MKEIDEQAMRSAKWFCETTECDDCPVYINKIENRSKYEKCSLQVTCCEANLYPYLKIIAEATPDRVQ